MTAGNRYIIIDLNNHRFKAGTGWTTQENHAKLFTKDEVHDKIKKLRADKFKKITFKRVEIPKENKRRAKHLEAVKFAVKREINNKKEIIRMMENGKRTALHN